MASALSSQIAARLAQAIETKGRASLAVSGGSTPAALYRLLSAADLDWSRVTLVLVDERWVKPEQSGSNERFVTAIFSQGKAAQSCFVGLWQEGAHPEEAAAIVENTIVQRLLLPFDVVVLGMGEDGHTASWFPHCIGLDEALGCARKVTHIRAHKSAATGPYLDRVTLCYGAIKDAGFIALMIAGDAKRETLETVCRDGPIEDMPARAILRARPDLQVCWAP